MLILSLFLTLATWDDLRKALEFQYESELKQLRQELVQTQNSLAEKERELRTCQSSAKHSEKPQKTATQKASRPSPSEIERRRKDYQSALQLMDEERWNEALLAFEAFAQSYPESNLADNAIFLISEVYLHRGEKLLARSELQRLLQLYPQSDRRKAAELRLQSIEDSQNKKTKGK